MKIEESILSEKEKQNKMPKVNLFIPKDTLNPCKHRYVSINGVEYYLAVGKSISVPECVATEWNNSYSRTIEAQESINTDNQLS